MGKPDAGKVEAEIRAKYFSAPRKRRRDKLGQIIHSRCDKGFRE
jgi:hypothetical protein